jgi:hypothetical protein
LVKIKHNSGLNQFDSGETYTLQISVINPTVTYSSALFKLNTSSTDWNSLKINFMATTRPDM